MLLEAGTEPNRGVSRYGFVTVFVVVICSHLNLELVRPLYGVGARRERARGARQTATSQLAGFPNS